MNLTVSELRSWSERCAGSARRMRFGLARSAAELVAPARFVDYVTWYTEGFFVRQATAAHSTLFVHELTDALRCRTGTAEPEPPLRQVWLRESGQVSCVVDEAHAAVHLFIPGMSGPDHLVVVMRVLRALILNALLDEGCRFVRGAGLAMNEAGVLLVGRSMTGKTTLLLRCLDQLKATLVANDKAALVPGDDIPTMFGFPIAIGIRPGGILALADGALRGRLIRDWTERFGDIRARYADDTRLFLRPQELAAVAGGRAAPSCRLRLIIEPRMDPGACAPWLAELDAEERGALWDSHTLSVPTAIFPEQAAVVSGSVHTCYTDPGIPAYRLVQPPGDGNATIALIEELLYSVSASKIARPA